MTKQQKDVMSCRDGATPGRTTSNFNVEVNPLKLDVIIRRDGSMAMEAPANDTSRRFAEMLYNGELADTKPGTRFDLAVHEMRFMTGPKEKRELNVFPKPLTVLDDDGQERRMHWPGTQLECCTQFVIQFKHFDESVKYENGIRVDDGATKRDASDSATDVSEVM